MEAAIISGKSKRDIQLLVSIAERLGMKARFLTIEEFENISMAIAIGDAKAGEYVDTEEFLMSLK